MLPLAKVPTEILPIEAWDNSFRFASVTDAIILTNSCRTFREYGKGSLYQKRIFSDLFKNAHPIVKEYANAVLSSTDSSSLISKIKRVFTYQAHIVSTFSSSGPAFLASFSLSQRITPEFYEGCSRWLHTQHLLVFGLIQPNTPFAGEQNQHTGHAVRANGRFLYEIPQELLLSLPQVQVLDLEHNNISYLVLDLLATQALRSANFSRNDIRTIEGSSDQILSDSPLEELDLTINQLAKFPSAVKRLPNLTTLLLGNNEIKNLPDDIREMSSLQKLDVSANRLVSVSSQISQLASLHSFNLANNPSLGRLPDLSGLGQLITLNISNIGITSLPKGIETLPLLENLDASGNSIQRFPTSLGSSRSIKILNLSKNQIKVILDEASEMSSLRELHLSGNMVTRIPTGMDQLEKLYLYGNPIAITKEEASTYPFTIYFKFPKTDSNETLALAKEPMNVDHDPEDSRSLALRLREVFLNLFRINLAQFQS